MSPIEAPPTPESEKPKKTLDMSKLNSYGFTINKTYEMKPTGEYFDKIKKTHENRELIDKRITDNQIIAEVSNENRENIGNKIFNNNEDIIQRQNKIINQIGQGRTREGQHGETTFKKGTINQTPIYIPSNYYPLWKK